MQREQLTLHDPRQHPGQTLLDLESANRTVEHHAILQYAAASSKQAIAAPTAPHECRNAPGSGT
jgi:hypothetical protein